jgi:hypothetical protein
MKLDRAARRAAVTLLSIVGATACSSARTAPPVTAPTTLAVGTATLMVAELTDADEAPRVGKPQRSLAGAFDADDSSWKNDAPHRHAHRRGGGFSGYK